MENKSNSLNRIKRHQREKVLRFSIRKYSFGAASVAVAALMFLGARVASADTVSGSSSQSTAGVVQPNDKGDSPVATKEPTENKSEVVNNSLENKETALVENGSNTVDKSQLRTVVEELNSLLSTKLNLDDSVLSSVKERVQRAQALLNKADAVQKDINELKELLSADLATLSNATKESSKVRESNTGTEAEKPVIQSSSEVRASEENQTVSAKKDSLKVSVDQLQVAISEVPEHDTTKEVLKKANEVMVLAQGVLQNTTVSLTDVEQMNKLVKRMFISVKNATTRLSSGSRDPRNGQRIAKGTGFRADVGRVEGALNNVKEYISEDRFSGGGTSDGQRARTIDKTFMTAKYSTEGNKKFITYDVYFQNDGMALSGQTGNAFWFYPPRDILYSGGNYVRDTIVEAYYERYRKNAGATGRLSDNPDNFTKLDTYNAIEQIRRNGTNQDDSTRRQWGDRISLYQLDGGPTRDNQTQQMLKSLQNNEELNRIIRLNNNPRGSYPGLSYSQLLTISGGQNYAYKYHVKMRLKDDVTPGQAQNAGTIAVTAKEGKAFNALQAYVYAATGTRLESRLDAQLYPIKGKEVTTTVGASLGDVSNPVASNFVVRNDDTKDFPNGMSWEWLNGEPNTRTAGVFKPQAKATYSDHTSNTATATLKVKPKTPVIDQRSVNEKAGKTGQNVVVTVQDGVPDGSTVTLYKGTAVIGRGRTSGRTATINVSGALPSTAITAKTTVTNNYGTVESELSAPATPTEVPDRVAPTVSINGNRLTANADDNRFIIYRGANFNPTFRVQDDKNNVTLSITDLPKGVANVSTNGSKDLSYTIPGNTVATDAPFGENIATVVASDGRNSATYRFKYRIVDIQAKNSTTENRALGSALGNPHDHFKVAESNTVENDKYYPDNMRFVWKELNTRTFQITDVPNNTKLNEIGTITKYIATAVFPNTVNSKTIDRVNYTIYTPTQKPVQMTFNVTDNVKPTVKLVADNGSDTTLSESTATNALPKVTVYRGENATVTVKASDNTGKVQNLTITNLPTGLTPDNSNRTSDNATDTTPLTKATTGKVDKTARVEEKVATVTVSDKSNPANTTTVKFKVDVKEQKEKYTPTVGTTPVAVNNIGSISTSDLDKIKNSVSVPNLSPEATRDGGVTKTLKNNGAVTTNNGKKYVTVEVTYPDRSKDEVPVEVQQNTNVVKRPIINLKQGETLSEAEMKTIVELQDGTNKQPLPADAVVTATFNTNTVKDGNWTNITVRFNDGTTKTVSVNYNVKATFPVANTVYDFRGVTRTNDSESNYYINKGLPNGMNWFVKKGTETKPNAKIQTYLATDGLGKTDYTFGAYYAASRFNDNESNINLKLKHEGTVSHHVYDVMAAANKITVNNGATLTEANAKAAVTKVAGSEDLPVGTTYEWVADENGTALTNKTVTEFGEATRYVKVTLPKSQETSNNAPEATQRQSSKIVRVTMKVNETVKPTVKLVGDNGSDTTLSESTATNALPKVTVYRGETATVTVKASDNTGKVQNLTITNLPTGLTPDTNNRTSDNATDAAPLTKATTGKVDKTATVEAKVATVTVSDKSNPANTTTVKFKVDVKEQKDKYTPTAGTTPVAVNNIGSISNSDLEKIKNSVTVPNLSQEATRDGITKTLKDSGRVTVKNGKKYVTVEVTYPDRSKDEVPVEVQQNTNVQKQPTIYVVKGETISNEELRKFVYLPNGAQKEELPSTATVTATLDTASRGSKTTNVTVTFQGSNPVVVPVTYEVIQNFPVANKVYDFAGVSRGNGASDYYVNQGLRQGMSWFVEKETVEGGRKVFKKVSSDNNMNSQIASDITAGVGEYRYKLGAKFREGRFTNQAEEAARLSYSGEIVHTVYDVVANTTKVEATYGSTLTNSQAQSAVMKATNSQNLPAGTTYEWVANASGAAATNLTVSTYGEETRYVKVTLPKTREAGSDSAAATQVNPYKVIEVKVKVNETVKPTVKLVSDNGDVTLSESTVTNALPKVTVYRGENATVTVKASDNTGKVQNLTITNLPTGLTPDTNNRTSDTATDATPLTKPTTGKVDKTATVEAKVVTVTVSDKSNPANTTTVQFKVDVKAQNEKYTPTAGTTVKVGNIGTISQPDGDKIKNSVTVPNLSPEATQDGGVTKTLKDNGRVTVKNGKNYVTVEVTYPDRSKDEVDVAVEEVLKAGEKNPTNKAVDGQPYISNEKVINPNKEDATFTATQTNGLTVGTEGKVTGIPTGITWTGNETEKIVKIPVTVTRTGETPVNVEISVVVQRDVTKTPTFTVGTQDPTTGNVDVTVSGVPNGTKVKLPGVKGEKVVTDGKVTLPNDELPATPQTGKGSAQEEGKLPKEGTSDITIPKKLVESGTPTFTIGTQDPTTGNVDVTVTGVSNGTKVKLPGVKGEKVVTDGKVTLPNDELPETPQTGKGSAQEEGKLPKEGTSDITIPGKISSSKGEPEVQTETPDYTNPISSNGVDGNGNLIDPPTVELPEFNGGVNGELPEPITLPELTIEVRWIDEDGNVLKPSVKTGNEKNAEHGTIPGYEFVRTMIDENEPVMTHIFRKVGSNTNTIPVAPVTPAPSPTTPVPDAVTPNADQVDTKTTNDNGAKANDSQNVLPNTGTESNAALASLGLLGMLGGLGLALGKKKED